MVGRGADQQCWQTDLAERVGFAVWITRAFNLAIWDPVTSEAELFLWVLH